MRKVRLRGEIVELEFPKSQALFWTPQCLREDRLTCRVCSEQNGPLKQ